MCSFRIRASFVSNLFLFVWSLFFPYPVFFRFKSLSFLFGSVLSVSGLLPFQISFLFFRMCSFRIRASFVSNLFLSVWSLFFPYPVFFRFKSLSFLFGPVLSVSGLLPFQISFFPFGACSFRIRSSSVSNLFFVFSDVFFPYQGFFRLKPLSFRLEPVLSVSGLLPFQVSFFPFRVCSFRIRSSYVSNLFFGFGCVLSVSELLPFQVSFFPFRVCSFRIRSSSDSNLFFWFRMRSFRRRASFVSNLFLSVWSLFFPYPVFLRFKSLPCSRNVSSSSVFAREFVCGWEFVCGRCVFVFRLR